MKIVTAFGIEKAASHWGDTYFEKLREIGFDGCDYPLADTNVPAYSLSPHEFEKHFTSVRRRAEQADFEISQVHGPWRHPPMDATPEQRAERLEKMQTSIRAAALMGSRYWVIHPIMPMGLLDLDQGTAQQTWDLNLEFMSELLKTAKQCDVVICLENMPFTRFSISQPSDILRFVQTMNDDHFKICLDTGHAVIWRGMTAGNALRIMGRDVVTMHIHDNNGTNDLHRCPHFGIIDWTDFRAAMDEVGYSGTFSLEPSVPNALPTPAYESAFRMLYHTANALANK